MFKNFYHFNFQNNVKWKFIGGQPSVIRKTITGAFPLSWQDGTVGNLVNYSVSSATGKAVTVDGVEYGVPDGYTLRDNEVSTATAFYCTRDSDDATGTLNLTTGVFTASTFTPGKTTKTVNAHGVPLEYQEAKYLKSNGNGEYIDTGVVPVQGDDVSVDIYDFQAFQTGGKNLLGLTYYGEWSSAKGWYVGIAGQSGKNAWNCRPTVSPDPTYNALGITTGHSYKLSINGNGYYVDDVRKITLGSLIQTIDTGKSLWLFAVNGGTPAYNSGIWAYGVTDIKVNGVLVRRFVPVKRLSDDAYGLYDLVTNAFFGNEGDGAFTGGSANQLEVPLFHYRGVGDKTANLFDEATALPSFGFAKNGEYYEKTGECKETIYTNDGTEGRFCVRVEGSSSGTFVIRINYTDDTTSELSIGSTEQREFLVSDNGKTVSYIETDTEGSPAIRIKHIDITSLINASYWHIPYGYDTDIITVNGGAIKADTMTWTPRGGYSTSGTFVGTHIAGSKSRSDMFIGGIPNYASSYINSSGIPMIDLTTELTEAEFNSLIAGKTLYYAREDQEIGIYESVPVTHHHIYTDEQGFCIYDGGKVDIGLANWVLYTLTSTEVKSVYFADLPNKKGGYINMYSDAFITASKGNNPDIGDISGVGPTASVQNRVFIGVDAVEIPDAQTLKTKLNGKYIYYQLEEQNTWVTPLFDTLSYLGGEVLNIGHTTLSAGTHSITGAKSNGRFQTSLGTVGTLSGTSITIPSGYGDVEVLFELATPVTKTPTMPTIQTETGQMHFDVLTDVKPNGGSVTYKSRTVSV